MKLSEIINGLKAKVIGDSEVIITGVTTDSRSVRKDEAGGALFVAVPGEHVDGHAFVKSAVENGALAVLAERETSGVKVVQVIVDDVRGALSHAADAFYGRPSMGMIVIGITGTNGKTTTTYILEAILKKAGFVPGVIGTVNYRYADRTVAAPHTTPQAPELQRILREMVDAHVTHCVMEVSSHALEQKRAQDCRFNAVVFTNLTHEHLDYHGGMNEYFRCKSILFNLVKDSGAGISITNIDDAWGRQLKKDYPASMTYSLKHGADIFPQTYTLLNNGIEATISTPSGRVRINSHLVGEYNLQNILAAIAAATAIGVDAEAISAGVNALVAVPGRLQKIDTGKKGFKAFVDYAHTADALERALSALRAISSGRIITVFGCGGNRDRLKRPKMGEVATRLSDIAIITSDNPRDEDALEIIKEIETGIGEVKKFSTVDAINGKGYAVMPDRGEAIRAAVSVARGNDVILVAGKGHEDYQIVKGKKTHFDDFEMINKCVKESAQPR